MTEPHGASLPSGLGYLVLVTVKSKRYLELVHVLSDFDALKDRILVSLRVFFPLLGLSLEAKSQKMCVHVWICLYVMKMIVGSLH